MNLAILIAINRVKMTVDYGKYVGCYAKRFYTPFKEGNIFEIKDVRGGTTGEFPSGDFQVASGDDEWWWDIEDCVIITDEEPEVADERVANIHNDQYKGYNPYKNEES
jgi:hypothetical protein